MLNNYITSQIRTWVPLLAGWLLSLPVTPAVCNVLGVDSATARRELSTGLGLVLAGLWFLVARTLEQRWPAAGVLIGVPAKPDYSKGKTVVDVKPVSVFDLPDTSDPLEEDGPDPNTPGASTPPPPAPVVTGPNASAPAAPVTVPVTGVIPGGGASGGVAFGGQGGGSGSPSA